VWNVLEVSPGRSSTELDWPFGTAKTPTSQTPLERYPCGCLIAAMIGRERDAAGGPPPLVFSFRLGPLWRAFSCRAVSHALPNRISGTIARTYAVAFVEASEPLPADPIAAGGLLGMV
jgi:hypothetical protein